MCHPVYAAPENLAGQFWSLFYLPDLVCKSHSCSQQCYRGGFQGYHTLVPRGGDRVKGRPAVSRGADLPLSQPPLSRPALLVLRKEAGCGPSWPAVPGPGGKLRQELVSGLLEALRHLHTLRVSLRADGVGAPFCCYFSGSRDREMSQHRQG